MKYLVLILTTVTSLGAFASDTYSSCADATGIFEYSPVTQELTYNTNEVYDKSAYTVHFAGIKSATKGSCVANDGNTYEYENTQYTLKVTYLNGNSGAEELNCEEGFDALPAALNCVKEN
ncbi:MAG: hypothetical protein ACRBBP_05730 [Bdellovibrionales bacterium]